VKSDHPIKVTIDKPEIAFPQLTIEPPSPTFSQPSDNRNITPIVTAIKNNADIASSSGTLNLPMSPSSIIGLKLGPDDEDDLSDEEDDDEWREDNAESPGLTPRGGKDGIIVLPKPP